MKRKELEIVGGQFASKIGRHITATYYDDYSLAQIKFDWAPTRRSSRGGIYAKGPGINIAMNWVPTCFVGIGRFYEYKSFDSDKVIGGFFYDDPVLKLKAIIVHEMAHTIQFFHYKKEKIKCKPHGPIFKKYYAELREEFINNLLPDQKELKMRYITLLKEVHPNATIYFS
jgi:hypothetical protein